MVAGANVVAAAQNDAMATLIAVAFIWNPSLR
jgi:hypothetical protein